MRVPIVDGIGSTEIRLDDYYPAPCAFTTTLTKVESAKIQRFRPKQQARP